VPYSFEVGMDATNLLDELARDLVDPRLRAVVEAKLDLRKR